VGWRFRKSVRILPGVRLNFGEGGFTSTTLGGRWFKTNVGGRGVKHTLSVPGTGVSYQTDTGRGGASDRDPRERQSASRSNSRSPLLILLVVLLALLLLAVIGVGVLVVLTLPSAAAQRRPAETSAPPVVSKTQAGSAPVSRGRS
jgi:hypothetical protein